MTAPLLYVYGDDDLIAERLVARFATAVAGESEPLERWDLAARVKTAPDDAARLRERLATPVMFGGGTLAVVGNPGNLVVRNADLATVVEAIKSLAPGNALALVEDAQSNAKGPRSQRLAKAVKEGEGTIVAAMAPGMSALGSWIQGEADDRRLMLGAGAAAALAERLGSHVSEGDVERRHLTRIAVGELDKLALRHATDGGAITPDDVRDLVAEATPGSLWALGDAVGERLYTKALVALERVLGVTPEPVLVAVLHRRIVELLHLGDRTAAGESLVTAARAAGLKSEYRARILAKQARNWTTDELAGALRGLVEIDAAVKRVPGYEADPAQQRLRFVLWVTTHVPRRSAADGVVGSG